MKNRKTSRWLASLVAVSILLSSSLGGLAAAPLAVSPASATVAQEDGPACSAAPTTPVSATADGQILVRVTAPAGTDLSKYGGFVARRIPEIGTTGTAVYYGAVSEAGLAALKADRRVQDVARVQQQAAAPDGTPGDPDLAQRTVPNADELRAYYTDLRENPPEPTARPDTSGWWDITAGGHNATEAWDAGYTGQGVVVAVNDSGVDMAHPDFWGTEARYENVSGDSYYDYFEGWPVALNPFANYLMAFDLEINGELTDLNTFANPVSNFADTSLTGEGATITFNGHVYQTTGTAHPANPIYHAGTHPDWGLTFWGEWVGILVVDEDGDDLYDTVYVDLNNNYDFRDDKPVRKDTFPADNYVQGADELSWWDANLDGYPDVSGGMLYYIADGEHCPPFFDVYFGCSTNGTGYYDPPGNGDVVAFMYSDIYATNHGQLCASNVVAQGNINGDAPAWKPDSLGGLVQGPGKDAKVVPVGDIYWGFEQSVEQAWWFQALGYDGQINDPSTPGGDDNMQASSNSFGPWGVYEDGWDEWSRVPTYLNAYVNPYTSFFMSSGNTGSGYGTTGAPQPVTAIQTAASSQYNSNNSFEPLASEEQITAGDITPFSSRGPSANNQLVPHVAANGAWGTGALALNEWLDGWTAWTDWGGTSRSGPLAMGAATLLMDAYEDANGTWPDWYTTRQVLMQGANHIGYDPLTSGTGYVNAGRSAKIAAGDAGVTISPDYWDAGDFEGMRYPGGFAHIALPGETYTTEVTIKNVAATSADVTVSDAMLEPIQSIDTTFTTVDQSLEEKLFHKPDYLFSVEELLGGPLPAGTQYVVAELLHTHDTFDIDGDEVVDNSFRVIAYDWTDINGDGNLWTDANNNGLVEGWDVDGGEMDRLEYARFDYDYNQSLYVRAGVGDPLNRVTDGLFFGIRHRDAVAAQPTTELTLRVTAYGYADWAALDTSTLAGETTLAGGETLTATVALTAPTDFGLYQGAILVAVEPDSEDAYETIVPVIVNVAYSGDLLDEDAPIVFGDVDDEDALYPNGFVNPIMDWRQGRGTAGDWRFFFFDQEEDPNGPGEQAKFLARTTWTGEAPPADIDTYLLGPDYHFSSISNDIEDPVFGSSYGVPGPFWGPHSLRIVGQSESPQLSSGHWAFETDTGAGRDYTIGNLNKGLNGVQIHAMRYDGKAFDADYEIEVGYVTAPELLTWDNYAGTGVTLTTNMTVSEGIAISAFGLSPVEIAYLDDEFLPGPSSEAFSPCAATYTHTFSLPSLLAQLHVGIDDFGNNDPDLFLLYDFNGDGQLNCATEVIGSSGSSSGTPENITLEDAPPGLYQVAVDPYTVVGAGVTFDLTIDGLELGDTIQVTNVDADAFGPDDPITFDVVNKAGTCDDGSRSCLGGWVRVALDTDSPVTLFDIPTTPRYSQADLAQLSYKEVSADHAVPGDVLTYTLHVINTDPAAGAVTITDTLPTGVTLLDATAGYTLGGNDTLIWEDVPIAAGGGSIVTSDFDWMDISGVGDVYEWYDWWGYFGLGDDDEGSLEITLPFTYTFFGLDYDTVYVDANGQVTFDWGDAYLSMISDGQIPGPDTIADSRSFGAYDNRIAVLFGDQAGPYLGDGGTGMTNSGEVFTYADDGEDGIAGTGDDRFIIQWDEWHHSFRPCYYMGIGCGVPFPDNTYQLTLYADGRAKAQYAEINELPPIDYFGAFDSVGDAGAEAPDGTHGYAWDQVPAGGTAWEYQPMPTSRKTVTVTVRVNAGLEDAEICNVSKLDNGYRQITELEACTQVLRAELEAAKTVEPADAADGDTVTFTLSITNTGPLNTLVDIEDTLDAGLVFGELITPTTGFAFDDPSNTLIGSATVENGTVFELVYTAEIDSDSYNDELCNVAMLDNNFGTDLQASACVDVNAIDLSGSSKTNTTADAEYWPGTMVTYEITVSNDSLVSTPASISDVLPDGLTFGGFVPAGSGSYDDATGTVTADLGTIAAGDSETLVFTATIDGDMVLGTWITNTATIEDGDADTWTVADGFIVEGADFSTSTKDAPTSAAPGDSFSYTITLTNSGTLTDTAMVTDVIPAEVAFVTYTVPFGTADYEAATRTFTWEGEVAPAQSIELVIEVEVPRGPNATAVNEGAQITGGNTTITTDPTYTEITSAVFDVTKSIHDGSLRPLGKRLPIELSAPWGQTVTYTLHIYNRGTISAAVMITDPLPAGVIVQTDDLADDVVYDMRDHTITWQGVITDGYGMSIDIPVKGMMEAALMDETLFNVFMLVDEWGYSYESNSTQLHLTSTELEVLKRAESIYVAAGDVISYSVMIRNVGDNGTGTAAGAPWPASLLDVLPEGTTYVYDSLRVVKYPGDVMPVCTHHNDEIVCQFDVDAGYEDNEFIFNYAVRTDSDLMPGDLLTNTVTTNDSFGILVQDVAVVEVLGPQAMLSPMALAETLYSSETATATVALSNTGTEDLTWSLAETPAADWLSADTTSGTLTPSEAVSITMAFDPSGLTEGDYTTTVEVTTNDPSQPKISVPVTLTVVADYDTVVAPTSLAESLYVNETATQTLTITNNGSETVAWDLAEAPAADWLSADLTSGSLAPSGSVSVTVTFDATGLAGGDVMTELQITTDDPNTPQIDVPVTLTVMMYEVQLPVILMND